MRCKEHERALREMQAAQIQSAEARGEMMAAYKHLQHDKEFVEILRAREWHRSGYRGMVQDGDQIRNIPEGWPKGIDGEEVVAEWIFTRTEKMRKQTEEAVAKYREPGPMEERFGKLLEGEEK